MARGRYASVIVGSPAFRLALLTLVCLQLATLAVNLSVHALLAQEPFRVYALNGVLMVTGDGLLDLPLLFLLHATARMRPAPRWTLMTIGTLIEVIAACCYDTAIRMWVGMIPATQAAAFEWCVRSFPINLYNTAMWVMLLAFQAAYLSLVEHSGQLGAARAAERASHLAALRLQLNPHFLFNALNALSSLVVLGRKDEAEDMIGRLAAFLRTTLGADLARPVRLEDEFETLESYVEIERVRFGERLDLSIALPASLRDAMVPPFLIQPLVENAMKYGVAPSRRAVTVAIAAAIEAAELVLSVSDDGDSTMSVPGGTGVGLANVRERLAIAYDGEARLEACRVDTGGYCARICIPLGASLAMPAGLVEA